MIGLQIIFVRFLEAAYLAARDDFNNARHVFVQTNGLHDRATYPSRLREIASAARNRLAAAAPDHRVLLQEFITDVYHDLSATPADMAKAASFCRRLGEDIPVSWRRYAA